MGEGAAEEGGELSGRGVLVLPRCAVCQTPPSPEVRFDVVVGVGRVTELRVLRAGGKSGSEGVEWIFWGVGLGRFDGVGLRMFLI